MTIKQETKFKTTDGREFDDETEAQRHDALIIVRQEYEHALFKMNKLTAETTRTADGYLFEFGIFKDYWFVTPGYVGMPTITKTPYFGWNWNLSTHTDQVIIITSAEIDGSRYREFAINNLYREKKNAIAAMIEAQKTWLSEQQKEVEENLAAVERGQDPTRR